ERARVCPPSPRDSDRASETDRKGALFRPGARVDRRWIPRVTPVRWQPGPHRLAGGWIRRLARILPAVRLLRPRLPGIRALRAEEVSVNRRTYKDSEQVDFAIVGSGPAGAVLARELSRAGFDVVVLEQGPRLEPANFKHDELDYWFANGLLNKPRDN